MEFDYSMGPSFTGKWRGDLTPTANGVTLRTEDSYSAGNWLTKILIYTFFDMDGFAKEWNRKLKERAETMHR
jgi:hypothetical protein